MHFPYSHSKINLILNDIQDYKKVKIKKNPTSKIEAILKLRDALVKHNYPNQLIYSKIIDILKEYDIPPSHIKRILDFYAKDPSRMTKFFESGDIFSHYEE